MKIISIKQYSNSQWNNYDFLSVDAVLDAESTNAVQNKVVTKALDSKIANIQEWDATKQYKAGDIVRYTWRPSTGTPLYDRLYSALVDNIGIAPAQYDSTTWSLGLAPIPQTARAMGTNTGVTEVYMPASNGANGQYTLKQLAQSKGNRSKGSPVIVMTEDGTGAILQNYAPTEDNHLTNKLYVDETVQEVVDNQIANIQEWDATKQYKKGDLVYVKKAYSYAPGNCYLGFVAKQDNIGQQPTTANNDYWDYTIAPIAAHPDNAGADLKKIIGYTSDNNGQWIPATRDVTGKSTTTTATYSPVSTDGVGGINIVNAPTKPTHLTNKKYVDEQNANIIEIAEGKTKTFVMNYEDYFAGVDPLLEVIGFTGGFITLDGVFHTLNELRVGDIFLFTELEIPDRWVSNIEYHPEDETQVIEVGLHKLEATKVNLNDYVAKADIDTEMSDVSENPVQNKIVKEYVDDAVANATVDIDVDEALDAESTNPVQNKVVKEALDGKLDRDINSYPEVSITQADSTMVCYHSYFKTWVKKGVSVNGDQTMGRVIAGASDGQIKQNLAPSADNDLTNKAYVDAKSTKRIKDYNMATGNQQSMIVPCGWAGNINNIISGYLVARSNGNRGKYDTSIVSTEGGTGAILQNYAPTADNHLTNKLYVDEQDEETKESILAQVIPEPYDETKVYNKGDVVSYVNKKGQWSEGTIYCRAKVDGLVGVTPSALVLNAANPNWEVLWSPMPSSIGGCYYVYGVNHGGGANLEFGKMGATDASSPSSGMTDEQYADSSMGGNAIRLAAAGYISARTPSRAYHAANKKYVDSKTVKIRRLI